MTVPDFSFERPLWENEFHVIGVDEVGRGCLAGPVYAAAFCFPLTHDLSLLHEFESLGINDSKKISPQKRQKIFDILQTKPTLFTISSSDVEEINTHGIVKATHSAMTKAIMEIVKQLHSKKIHILVDGSPITHPDIYELKQTPIIKGDSLSLSIAAASIMAKVTRDAFMTTLSEQYPHYSWHENKGYGTLSHRKAIQTHGISDQHRTLFVRNVLKQP